MTFTSVLAVSTLELSLRMGVALAVTLGVLTVLTGLAKKRRGAATDTNPITINHQQQLTKHTTLTLLTAGQQQLLIATNPQTTTLLAQGTNLTPTTTPGTGTGSAGGQHPKPIDIRNPVKHLQNKTLRRG